ncbi:MAG: hypothetical protein AAGI52_09765 [Bacteroidota bacterium]
MNESQHQQKPSVFALLLSVASLLVLLGCSSPSPSVASEPLPGALGEQPEQSSDLVFDVVRQEVEEHHGPVADIHFGLASVEAPQEGGLHGIPEEFRDVEILSWTLSDHRLGTVYGIRGTDEAGEKSFIIDTDNDRRLDDERAWLSSAAVTPTLRYSGGNENTREIDIEIHSTPDKDQYVFRTMWTTSLVVDTDSLPAAVSYLGFGRTLLFVDADKDGSFEQLVNTEIEFPLGGRLWHIGVDFDRLHIRLTPGTGTSLIVGATAPPFELDVNIDRSKPTMLVFCYEHCGACSVAVPQIESIWQDAEETGHFNIVNIATNERERQANIDLYSATFLQVVQPDLWTTFGVTPTPAIVVLDGRGTVLYRGSKVSHELQQLLASFPS